MSNSQFRFDTVHVRIFRYRRQRRSKLDRECEDTNQRVEQLQNVFYALTYAKIIRLVAYVNGNESPQLSATMTCNRLAAEMSFTKMAPTESSLKGSADPSPDILALRLVLTWSCSGRPLIYLHLCLIPSAVLSLLSCSKLRPLFPCVFLLLDNAASNMGRFFASVALFSLATSVFAAPTLPDRYGKAAGGTEAQILTSKALSLDGINQLQLANFLENLEAAFFHEGAMNYTQKFKGHSKVNGVKTADVVRRIAAQESLHKSSIEMLLKSNGAEAVSSCKYSFPVTDEKSFLALSSIITNVGIGALINTVDKLSQTDGQLEASIASIIPVEARHDAFFRLYNKEVPNPTTFETKISGIWAYNLALDFIQHGSCGNLPSFIRSLPVFPDLQLVGSGMLSRSQSLNNTNMSRQTKFCNSQCSW